MGRSPADCCGLSCVPNKSAGDAGPPFVCGSSECVPVGGECTTDADCCPGLPCVALPGSTKGVCGYEPDGGAPDAQAPDGGPSCAAWGQTCVEDGDCCNDVPCTGGRCVFKIY